MKSHILYIIIVVLSIALYVSLTNKREVVIEKVATDTLYIERIDTFKAIQPVFKYETIIDSIYIEKVDGSGLKVPKTQRFFSEEGKYDAWVSGYEPNLDSVNVFQRTITNTITNTITKEIYPKTMDIYVVGGVNNIGGLYYPNVGLALKLRNDLLFGGDVGIYQGSLSYGLRIGYKLNKQKK